MDQDRILAAHPLSIFAQNASIVANVAAAVGLGVGIDDLAVKPLFGNTESVIWVHLVLSIHDNSNLNCCSRLSYERKGEYC